MPMTSGKEVNQSNRSRKRQRERFEKPDEKFISCSSLEPADLMSIFHETVFDEQIEKIYQKDSISQEFIDRIGKLYKPVVMEQMSKPNVVQREVSMNESLNNVVGASKNAVCSARERFEKLRVSKNQSLFLEYDVISHFQEKILKHCSEELLLPFSNFQDVVMGLIVTCLGEAFSNNEILSQSLCECINSLANILFDEEREYDSDIYSDNFDTRKRKRRKV